MPDENTAPQLSHIAGSGNVISFLMDLLLIRLIRIRCGLLFSYTPIKPDAYQLLTSRAIFSIGCSPFDGYTSSLFQLSDACRPAPGPDALIVRRALSERSELVRPSIVSVRPIR